MFFPERCDGRFQHPFVRKKWEIEFVHTLDHFRPVNRRVSLEKVLLEKPDWKRKQPKSMHLKRQSAPEHCLLKCTLPGVLMQGMKPIPGTDEDHPKQAVLEQLKTVAKNLVSN